MNTERFNPSVSQEGLQKNKLIKLREAALQDGEPLVHGQLIDIIAEFENEWFEANKDRIGSYPTLTPVQMSQRDAYVGSVDQMRIREILDNKIGALDRQGNDLKESDEDRDLSKARKEALEKIRMSL